VRGRASATCDHCHPDTGPSPLDTAGAVAHDDDETKVVLQYRSFVGRLGFVADGRPMILPVNSMADAESVVFCTAPGTKLSTVTGGARVAFEVDDDRPLHHGGWSVVVAGTAREVVDPAELDRLRRGPLRSWAAPAPAHWVRISIDEISGRCILET
jgi:uncharacterized protein